MTLLSAGLIGLATMVMLFVVASLGSRNSARRWLAPHWPLVYGLSLGVYFTSWTFYGAVGSASRSGFDYLPIYLGPLLAFTFGMPIIRRLVAIGRRHQASSIADFLAHRYGKSSLIGAVVAILAISASLPYIALQLNSIRDSIGHVAGVAFEGGSTAVGLVIALVLGSFAILFGTRDADHMVRHAGLVLAIAVETLLKLVALLLVAFTAFGLMGIGPVFEAASANTSPFMVPFDGIRFATLSLLSFCAILCLPRQFHMMVVESRADEDITKGRRTMVITLLITALVVPPIALAGNALVAVGASPDLYMLALPMIAGQDWIAVLAFVGGVAASTGMVIVTSLALSVMVSNDLINALELRLFGKAQMRIRSAREQILLRRAVIMMILLGAWMFSAGVKSSETLASLGLLAFAAMAQLAPALIGGLFWSRGNKAGALGGIISGGLMWILLLALPAYGVTIVPLDGLGMDGFSLGALICLAINTATYVGLSYRIDGRLVDRMQAAHFTMGEKPKGFDATGDLDRGGIRVADLRALVEHAIGEVAAATAFKAFEAETHIRLEERDKPDTRLLDFIETRLARVLGAASARVVLTAMKTAGPTALSDLTLLLGEAHKRQRFSHALLEQTLDNMSQGVSVVDKDMRMVAWNSAYLDLFDYPDGMVEMGKPVSELITYNVEQGHLETDPGERYVERRLAHYRSRLQHRFERRWQDGRTIEIEGNPLPNGGYVTTFTDISQAKASEAELKAVASSLERRVEDRTRALKTANDALSDARETAEAATRMKTRFLAAASHDLMQPLNAARLYASALADRCNDQNAVLADKIDLAIANADQLIRALLNISKLDAGAVEADIQCASLQSIFDDLAHEFEIQAEEKGLALTVMPSSLALMTDRGLLFSVLQNFIANAVRYTHEGRILVGAKRRGDAVEIAVFDTGPGIREEDRDRIFEEFTRLDTGHSGDTSQGLGLGLSVSKRISALLGAPIAVRSVEGVGTCFSITVPRAIGLIDTDRAETIQSMHDLSDLIILCVDDDTAILDAEHMLLEGWGCRVISAESLEQVERLLLHAKLPLPHAMLLDHQLADGETGLDIQNRIQRHFGLAIPTIFITADQGFVPPPDSMMLKKPIKPASLRAALETILTPTAKAAQ